MTTMKFSVRQKLWWYPMPLVGGMLQITLPPSKGVSRVSPVEGGMQMMLYEGLIPNVAETFITEPSGVTWGWAVMLLIVTSAVRRY